MASKSKSLKRMMNSLRKVQASEASQEEVPPPSPDIKLARKIKRKRTEEGTSSRRAEEEAVGPTDGVSVAFEAGAIPISSSIPFSSSIPAGASPPRVDPPVMDFSSGVPFEPGMLDRGFDVEGFLEEHVARQRDEEWARTHTKDEVERCLHTALLQSVALARLYSRQGNNNAEVSRLRAKLEACRVQLESSVKRIEDLEEATEGLKGEVGGMETALIMAQEKIQEGERSLKEALAANENLSAERDAAIQDRELAVRGREAARNEMVALQHENEQLESQLHKCQDDLNEARSGLQEAVVATNDAFQNAIEQAKVLCPALNDADLSGLDPLKSVVNGVICDDDEDEDEAGPSEIGGDT